MCPNFYAWHLKKITFVATIVLLALLSFFSGLPASAAQNSGAPVVQSFTQIGQEWYVASGGRLYRIDPEVVSIKFRPDIQSYHKDQFFSRQQYQKVRENLLGIIDLQVPAGKTAIEFVKELRTTGLFEFAEVNTFGKWLKTPNDPLFNNLYGLHNLGQTGGTVDADIDAPDAWDQTTGDPGVVVAVADSGTDIDHNDLGCNIWVNPGEDIDGDGVVWDLGDINFVDDDGNGRVDDLVGWNFPDNNNNPRGTFFHGTHVAGIVGACGNNGQGVIGVAGGWGAASPGSKMMPLNVGDDFPVGSVLDDAILYAANNGARVITLSLEVGPSTAINQSLVFAYNAGVFINNASGNSNSSVGYPANRPEVMAVGATDDDDNRASFSNHGPELEVVAPGVSIWSTQIGNTYGSSSGTSFASPHVAGLAALLFSENPTATNQDVRDCILQTAEDQVGNPAEDIPGRDNFYGFGRINAPAALDCISGAGIGQVYDTWISQSFAAPPYTPFHDCLRFTDNIMTIDSCGDSGALFEVPLFGSPLFSFWIASVVCDGQNLFWLGTAFDGDFLEQGANVMGGTVYNITEGFSFGAEGIENPDCVVPLAESGPAPYSLE
jgi:subtilisin family serine protease